MFYTLHRLVKWFFTLLILAGLFWLYQQRAALEPAWAWYDVYQNGGIERTAPLPILTGEGVTVLDGHTFEMKSGGKIYSVRLTGFEFPTPPLTSEEITLERQRRAFLRDAVEHKPVKVQVTYSNFNSVLGIVQAGSTNLNTWFVAHGLGHFNREYVKNVPRDLQYQFFAAQRAREKNAGLLALQHD
jgi:endonuclease YncB( thermonuclease family)